MTLFTLFLLFFNIKLWKEKGFSKVYISDESAVARNLPIKKEGFVWHI